MIPQQVLIHSINNVKGNPESRPCLGNFALAVQAELPGSNCNRLSAAQRTQVIRFISAT